MLHRCSSGKSQSDAALNPKVVSCDLANIWTRCSIIYSSSNLGANSNTQPRTNKNFLNKTNFHLDVSRRFPWQLWQKTTRHSSWTKPWRNFPTQGRCLVCPTPCLPVWTFWPIYVSLSVGGKLLTREVTIWGIGYRIRMNITNQDMCPCEGPPPIKS